MSNRARLRVPAFFSFGVTLLLAAPSFAASWQSKVSYGGSTIMDLYVPSSVGASPGIVVALHYCGGNSGSAHPWVQSLADQYGFIIIAPGAGGNCFDATPARSGERDAITKMVAYVVTQNHADPSKVFAVGASSGACMTQALLAAYPEVFAGGSVLAGVPAGAWTGGNAYGWTTPANRSAAEWGDLVRKVNPSFTGARPKVQLWHGTADTTLTYMPNFPAEVAQWTNVLGVSSTDGTTSSFKASQDTWARISYKNSAGAIVLETNVATGAPHDLSGRGLWPDVVRFFGLDVGAPTGGGGTGAGGAASAGSGGTAGAGTAGAGAATAGAGGVVGVAGAPSGSGGTPAGTAGAPSSSAGSPSVAGSPPSTNGGSSAAGTASASAGAPGATASSTSDDGGCSVSSTAQRADGAFLGLIVAGLGALIRRRRRALA